MAKKELDDLYKMINHWNNDYRNILIYNDNTIFNETKINKKFYSHNYMRQYTEFAIKKLHQLYPKLPKNIKEYNNIINEELQSKIKSGEKLSLFDQDRLINDHSLLIDLKSEYYDILKHFSL